jgi:hypothetical protein
MDGILQSLGGFAKNTAGRYIGSQALGGAGAMLLGPIGGLLEVIGALNGGNLFNQNTYSQQMYNNLTSEGKAYVVVYMDLVEFYKDTINLVLLVRTLGTIANNLC